MTTTRKIVIAAVVVAVLAAVAIFAVLYMTPETCTSIEGDEFPCP